MSPMHTPGRPLAHDPSGLLRDAAVVRRVPTHAGQDLRVPRTADRSLAVRLTLLR